MSIFLLVLKIIGIVLLSIIGLVLMIVGLVLFVPIRYKVDGDYHEKIVAGGRISWLLHLITVTVTYNEDGLDTAIRILGIKYKKRPPKQKKKSKRNQRTKDKESKVDSAKVNLKDEYLIPDESDYTLEGFEEDHTDTKSDALDSKDDNQSENESEQNGIWDRIREFVGKVYDLTVHFRAKIKRLMNKVRAAVDNLEYYLNLMMDEHVQSTILNVLALVVKAIKRILPKRVKGQVHFGFAESDTMGKALAFLGVLYPLYYGKIEVEPDYEQAVMEGSLVVKGRIFVISLLVTGWKLYFNKDLRKVIAAFKKEVKK